MSNAAKSFMNALPQGSQVHWYTFIDVIGQGAFGITYLATDTNLNRKVAIKEYLPGQFATRNSAGAVEALSSDLADDYSVGLQRFIAEAQTLARFEHPNIVRVHNVFEANKTAYMVMQYEDGNSLAEILRARGPLAQDEIPALVFPLLSGLEAIHATGFIHRDIKPGNIFIRRNGSPVLLDFGSARQSLENQTRTLTSFVSPGYAPIEQYTGKSDSQGPWTDIYGLGATLYRAITNEAPVNAIERGEALAHDDADTYQPMSAHIEGHYNPDLMHAIDHALKFRARDRPASIAEWRAELEAVFGPYDLTVGVPTEPVETSTQVRKTAKGPLVESAKRRRTAAIAAAVALLVAALTAGVVFLTGSDETAAPEVARVVPPAAPATSVEVPDSPPAEPDPSGTAVAVPAESPASAVEQLLAAAGQDLAEFRLMTPEDNNAYDKYRQVIVLDPGNPAATRGIEAISDRYLQLAYRDIDRGELDRAKSYVDKAETLAPGRPAIAEARAALTANTAAESAQSDTPAPSYAEKIKAFGKRFGDFVEEQQPEKDQSRGDSFLQKFGN